jgi:hypothetical protein
MTPAWDRPANQIRQHGRRDRRERRPLQLRIVALAFGAGRAGLVDLAVDDPELGDLLVSEHDGTAGCRA